MAISIERQPLGTAKPLSELPSELTLELTPLQRKQLREKFQPVTAEASPRKMADWIKTYPSIDFAAMQRTDENEPRNVIGPKLEVGELKGILHLSQFHLALLHSKRRSLFPIVFMQDEPWAMVAYRGAGGSQGPPSYAFDNGREQRWLSQQQALKQIHANGAIIGTVMD